MTIFKLFVLVLTMLFNAPSFGRSFNLQYPYNEDSLRIIEKVYLHTDRDSYYLGDDIWFKAYLIDASDRFLSNHSSNLHVELISPDGEIIDSRVVKITEGLGNGDFHLSYTL